MARCCMTTWSGLDTRLKNKRMDEWINYARNYNEPEGMGA